MRGALREVWTFSFEKVSGRLKVVMDGGKVIWEADS